MLAVATLALAAVTVPLAALVFQVNQVENVLTTAWQRSAKPAVVAVLPQQWGFFTKSGREPSTIVLVEDEADGWINGTSFPFGQPRHAFGWNRDARAEGIEIGLIHSTVAQAAWTDCESESSLADCAESIADAADAQPVIAGNTTPSAEFCGEMVLINISPSPWAFARIGQGWPTYQGLWVDVRCSTD